MEKKLLMISVLFIISFILLFNLKGLYYSFLDTSLKNNWFFSNSFILKNIDKEEKDNHLRTPIILAAQYNKETLVKKLYENGANINYIVNNGKIEKKDLWMRFFRDRGFASDMLIVFNNSSIIDLAIQGRSYLTGLENNNNKILIELLKMNISNDIILSSLDTAIIYNNIPAFDMLYADLNKKGLKLKIDINYFFELNASYNYPLLKSDILKSAIAKDELISKRVNEDGKNLLHLLFLSKKWYKFENRVFTENRFSTELHKFSDFWGESYEKRLNLVSEDEMLDLIDTMLKKGVDVNLKDVGGDTPFHYFTIAISLDNLFNRKSEEHLSEFDKKVIILFVKNGLDIYIKNNVGDLATDTLSKNQLKEFFNVYNEIK